MNRKITEEQARKIRELASFGVTSVNIAKRFGVCSSAVRRICKKRSDPVITQIEFAVAILAGADAEGLRPTVSEIEARLNISAASVKNYLAEARSKGLVSSEVGDRCHRNGQPPHRYFLTALGWNYASRFAEMAEAAE